jgi:hypothetical protein
MLETAMSMPEGRVDYLNEMLDAGKFPPEIAQRLRPTDKINMFTDENIQNIIQGLREEDPEVSKTLREGMKQEGATGRTSMTIADKEKDRELRRDLASMDRQIKQDQIASGLTPAKLAAMYQKQAEQLESEGKQDEADDMFAKSRRAAMLGAMMTPAAGKEEIDVGEAAGMPTRTPVAPNANAPSRTVKVTRDAKGNLIRAE